jgi:D-hexose-6-phosphate mutarotase
MAQIVSWGIKALFAIPLWLLGQHDLVFAYLGAVALVGGISAVAPWFGYKVKPLT